MLSMETGVNGYLGPPAPHHAMVVQGRDPGFVTLHFQLMVEKTVQEMATKRSSVIQMHAQVCCSTVYSLTFHSIARLVSDYLFMY